MNELVIERCVVSTNDTYSLFKGKFHYVQANSLSKTLCGMAIPPLPDERPLLQTDCTSYEKPMKHDKLCKKCRRKIEEQSEIVKVRLAKKNEGRY